MDGGTKAPKYKISDALMTSSCVMANVTFVRLLVVQPAIILVRCVSHE